MKKGYKVFLICFVILFFSISLIPLIKIDTKSKVSFENRPLAVFPQKVDNNFPKDFEKYINDRFAFRNEIVKMFRKYSYYMFGYFTSNGAISGKGNHIFIKEQYINHNFPNTLDIEEKVKNLNFHKPIFFVTAPTPALIKHKQLPDYIKSNVDEKNYTIPYLYRVVTSKKNHWDTTHDVKTSREFIDKYLIYPFDKAMFLNSIIDIYPDRNWHWVSNSPYVDMTAFEMLKKIKAYDPALNVDVSNLNKLDLSKYNVPCEQVSDFWGVIGFKVNNSPFLCRDVDENIKYLNYAESLGINVKPLPIWHLMNKKINNDKKLLIISDSFGNLLAGSLSSYFKEVVVLEFTAINALYKKDKKNITDPIKENYNYDYVLHVTQTNFYIDEEWYKNLNK